MSNDLVTGHTPVERGVPKNERRRRLVRALVASVFVIAAVGAFAIAVMALDRIGDLADDNAVEQQARARDECRDRLQADLYGAVGRAFSAPPAPNPARDAATTDIQRAAGRIAHGDELCAAGKAPLFVPTPVPPPNTG